MKTYYIYDITTDEYLGEIKAYTVTGAEQKAAGTIAKHIDTNNIAAFSEKY